MFERMDPKTLVMWLILAAILYLLLPFDLIPDLFGLPGRIDDLVVMGMLAWFYRKHARQYVATGGADQASGRGAEASSGPGSMRQAKRPKAFDPYEVLQVSRSASIDAIQAAYRARMKEYHPDKVAHLGADLQELALEKSQEIQRAYRQLHE
jgi:hypothetical protein